LIKEDNIVKSRYSNTLYRDELIGEEGGYKPKELIRGSQGLAES